MLPISAFTLPQHRWKFNREVEYITVGKGCSKKLRPYCNGRDMIVMIYSKECRLRTG